MCGIAGFLISRVFARGWDQQKKTIIVSKARSNPSQSVVLTQEAFGRIISFGSVIDVYQFLTSVT